MDTMDTQEKYAALKAALARYGKVAVAFSGGVDSVLLLKAAADALGDGARALTICARNFPEWERREAQEYAARFGVPHLVLEYDIVALPGFYENSPERCYHCKKAIFEQAIAAAAEHGFQHLADGTNADDANDFRPGTRAAKELGVISPLRDAGLGKKEIRLLLREFGIPAWDKPSFACLASRFPHGMRITEAGLAQVEQAERLFFELGFRNVRVRHHGDMARIELDPDERKRFFRENLWERVHDALRDIGYAYSALDLLGYRTGSMNPETPPRHG